MQSIRTPWETMPVFVPALHSKSERVDSLLVGHWRIPERSLYCSLRDWYEAVITLLLSLGITLSAVKKTV